MTWQARVLDLVALEKMLSANVEKGLNSHRYKLVTMFLLVSPLVPIFNSQHEQKQK